MTVYPGYKPFSGAIPTDLSTIFWAWGPGTIPVAVADAVQRGNGAILVKPQGTLSYITCASDGVSINSRGQLVEVDPGGVVTQDIYLGPDGTLLLGDPPAGNYHPPAATVTFNPTTGAWAITAE